MPTGNVIQILIDTAESGTQNVALVRGALTSLGDTAAELRTLLAGPAGLAAGVVALGVAAIAASASFSDYVEEMENSSEQTRVSIDRLRELDQVMTEAGRSPESLRSILTTLRREMEDGNALFQRYGITSDTVFGALIKISRGVRDGTISVTDAQALMGRGVVQLLPLLGTLEERLGDVRTRLVELDATQIAAAESFDHTADVAKTTIKSAWDQIVGSITVGSVTAIALVEDLWGAISGGDSDNFNRFLETAQEAARLARESGGEPTTPPTPKPPPTMSKEAMELYKKMLEAREQLTGAGGTVSLRPDPVSGDPFNLFDQMFGTPEEVAQRQAQLDATLLNIANVDLAAVNKKAGEVEITFDQWDVALKGIGQTAEYEFGTVLTDWIDAVVIEGANGAQIFHDAWHNALKSIAATALELGLGALLTGIGAALGGPLGGFLGGMGGKLLGGGSLGPAREGDRVRAGAGGDTHVHFHTLDTKTFRMATLPGGALYQAAMANTRGRNI